jgi:hypothetical protein
VLPVVSSTATESVGRDAKGAGVGLSVGACVGLVVDGGFVGYSVGESTGLDVGECDGAFGSSLLGVPDGVLIGKVVGDFEGGDEVVRDGVRDSLWLRVGIADLAGLKVGGWLRRN